MKRSKLYRARLQAFKRQDFYPLEEGIRLLKSMPTTKPDETVERFPSWHPPSVNQIVRGAMVLPQGTGKKQRVVVIAE